MLETPQRIEPALIEDRSGPLADCVTDLATSAAKLGARLHPKTAAILAQMVRIMNTYYSNLIEAHQTRPRDIENAIQIKTIWQRYAEQPPSTANIESAISTGVIPMRDLLVEAMAHVRVQEQIDRQHLAGQLPESASVEFITWLHRAFYDGASDNMLRIGEGDASFIMEPGQWRSDARHNVAVGRHLLPSSDRVAHSGHCGVPPPLQLHSPVSRRQWSRQPLDEPCDGAQGGHCRPWTLVGFAWTGAGT